MTPVKFTHRNFYLNPESSDSLKWKKSGEQRKKKKKRWGGKARLIAQFFLDILSHL